MRQVSVFGLGYVGTVLFGCMAKEGCKVTGVDIDGHKLDLIRSGKSPVIEEGIVELIEEAVRSGRADVTGDTGEAIRRSDVSFVCVGTPSLPNGSQDIGALKRVVEEIGKSLGKKDGYHVVVIRSTVLPGTVDRELVPRVESFSGKKVGRDFGVCYQPEFLREGSSIKDYYAPPFTVIGGDSERSTEIVAELFESVKGETIRTDIPTAEMLKMCSNAFHALKITFANEIGRISQSLGVDGRSVMDLICRDRLLNISPAYLRPGFAFGGSCLPKDVRGLVHAAKMNDVNLPVLGNIIASNNTHIEHAIDMVLGSGRKQVGMIGLSFKGGTDDLRESPLVTMAERFIGKGLSLKIYDPKVNLSRLIGANRRYIEKTIPHIASLMTDSPEEILAHAEVLVVSQRDEPFLSRLYSARQPGMFVLDLLDVVEREKGAFDYRGVCW